MNYCLCHLHYKEVTILKKKLNMYPNYLALPSTILYSIFFILPVITAFALAFTDWNIDWILKPTFNGVENFQTLFRESTFKLALTNTLWFAVTTTIFKTALGLILALAVVQPIISRNYLRTVFYMPAILSWVVVGLVFSSLLQMDGFFNHIIHTIGFPKIEINWLGDIKTALPSVIVTEIWKWSGFSMAIFVAGLQGIPREYYEACTVDGASLINRFRHITLPLLAPAFTIAITTNLIGGLRVFEQVYIMTGGGPGDATQVLSTFIYQAYSAGLLGRASALGILLFVFISVISLAINYRLKRKEVQM